LVANHAGQPHVCAHSVVSYTRSVRLRSDKTTRLKPVCPATNPEGSVDMNENKARVLIEKKTVINLLEGFAVATKHHLRGEQGIYYVDLYHLVKFLPPYALRTSAMDVSEAMTFLPDPNHSAYAQATASPSSGSFIPHMPPMSRQQGSSSSFTTMVSPPDTSPSPKTSFVYRKSNQMQTSTTEKTHYSSHVNEEGFLLPARMPPKFSFLDLFPFSLVVRFLTEKRQHVKGMPYATMRAKETPGAQNIPLDISLYLVSIHSRPSLWSRTSLILFCLCRAPMLLSCNTEK
jgi:ion channel-forming bestrophin family protein